MRHPYACIESAVELLVKFVRHDSFNRERGGDPDKAWSFMEQMWVVGQTNVEAFSSNRDREPNDFTRSLCHVTPQVRRIRYEDLLCEPARVLAAICELVDVRFDLNMAEPYETEAIETFRSALTLSTTDPKLMRRKKIDAAQADKWRRVKLPQPLTEEAKVLARGYCYSLAE